MRVDLLGLSAIALLATSGALAADRADDGFDVTRYALELTPDLAAKTVVGRETIRVRATTESVRRLLFTGNALVIDSAAIDGRAVVSAQRDGVLAFDLPAPLVKGRSATLTLSYHGRPARGVATSANALYSSYFACDWMICRQDRFGDKALFTLDLAVPAGLDTLSVGGRTGTRAGPGGLVIHSWRTPRAYSAYLFGFAVGRFARASAAVGSAKLSYLSDVADVPELKRRFAATPAMVRFFSEKAGVPLPVGDYTQLLVRESEAQEAATYAVIGIDALPQTPDDPAQDWAIPHELSHQWWGNLVTCETLKDFWLNEGIATFMTAAWKEHRYGRAAYDAELGVARARLAKARGIGFDKPLAWSGRYPTLGARRAVQYSKGALFMDHLRSTIGEAAFWRGVRGYTRRHSGGTVTSVDLQRAMERASRRDLKPMFTEWVFGADAD